MTKILIVEDDLALGQGLALGLRSDALSITLCATLADAREALQTTSFQLAILDIALPDGSGLDLMKEIKTIEHIPVLLLTANDMETDVVTGLELGADDYMTKPFSLAILRARVHTQLRRAHQEVVPYVQEPYYFDFDRMVFLCAGMPIELSKNEQKLLRLLVTNRGQILTRAALIDGIWHDEATFVEENALSVIVKRLRDKLEMDPVHPTGIKTVYGIGYIWTVA